MSEAEALRGRSLPELREMLRRQERLLADRKFLSRLPDKGQKISAFAEKLKVAITQEEDQNRRTKLFSVNRQKELDSSQYGSAASEVHSACKDLPLSPALHVNKDLGSAVQNQPSFWVKRAKTAPEQTEQTHGNSDTCQEKDSVSSRFPHHDPHRCVNQSSEALVEALERISIAGREHEGTSEGRENPFQGLPRRTPKMPHYMEVLEARATNPVEKKNTFKPNRGSPLSISAEERCHRENHRLDDITAAWLPPLHHAPTQMLPLQESIAIQVQQKAAYEEMQARLATQKLAQKLSVEMVAYSPEGEAGGRYREVRDEDGDSSAED